MATSNLQLFNRTITSPETQQYLNSLLKEKTGSFVNNLTALVSNNDKLQPCQPYTLMFAALKATALNLPLDNSLGFAYVIPYNDNRRQVCVAQFQLGYKGYKQLAMRTGQFKTIHETEVREGEITGRNRLTGEIYFNFIEDEEKRLATKIIGYVSYFKLLNGFESVLYMSVEEMEKHAKRYSETYKSNKDYVVSKSKWTTDFDAMALKTVVKLNLSRNAPLSVELIDAIKADQSVMYEQDKYDYVDVADKTNAVDEEKAKRVQEMFASYNNADEESDNEQQ